MYGIIIICSAFSWIPGQADVIIGRLWPICSFLWNRSRNSLWLSSRLKVRLKLVSKTWWTPAAITANISADCVCLIQASCFTVCCMISTYSVSGKKLTKAFEEGCKPPACFSATKAIACCEWGSGLRWYRHHHHHLLLCPIGLKSTQNDEEVSIVMPTVVLLLSDFEKQFERICLSTLLFCSTLKSSSWLCCVMRTLSAEVMQPLQAKQSFRVIFAFSSFCFAPS